MNKIWLPHYAPGVPHTIDPDQYPSLPAALEDYCRAYADNIAFINFGSQITYHQLDQFSLQLAAYLQQELKLQPGSRIAIMLPNTLQFPVALFAALRAGLVVVNINPLFTATELKHELIDSGAEAIIVLANFAHVVEQVLQEIPLRHVVVTEIGDLFAPWKRMLFNVGVRFILRQVPRWRIPGAHGFLAALKRGAQLQFIPPLLHLDDIAILQYTGGTTGTPKGAMLSHRNLLANILQCVAWVREKLKPGEETLFAALPLYHVFALMVSGFTFLALGSRCVLITNPKDIPAMVRCWRKYPPTACIGLNTLFLHLMENPAFQKLNFRRLKLAVSGGMATQSTVAQHWQKLTGCVITEGYGLTEASPVVTINPLTKPFFNQSIGLPVPATDVKVCDDHGQELGVDEIGELWVRGPQVMLGYWQNPQETAAVLTAQGWLKTGDMVRIDAQGFLYLVDRKKDLIIVSGFNVYPSEVEAVISAYPGVADVAVVGEPDERTGERVKALVVKNDPALTTEALLDYCHQQLTSYKIPKKIEFRTELPHSSLGKTLHAKEAKKRTII